jgi:uncharacterized protein YqeY
MLVDQIKARMFQAMKSGAIVEKEILRVAMGEITTDAARAGRKGDDEEATAILRKLVKSNDETLAVLAEGDPQRDVLKQENDVLAAFLPKSLDLDAICAALATVAESIKTAGNDGQATGIAMKELKKSGAVVNGKDVAAAVKKLRGG